jgi:hypothetical protein
MPLPYGYAKQELMRLKSRQNIQSYVSVAVQSHFQVLTLFSDLHIIYKIIPSQSYIS